VAVCSEPDFPACVSRLLWVLAFCFHRVLFLVAPSEQHRREKAGDDETEGELNEGVWFGCWFHGVFCLKHYSLKYCWSTRQSREMNA